MLETIRAGVIGTGFMGKAHCLAYGAVTPIFGHVPRPILATICDVDPTDLDATARAFRFERSTTDWSELVADPSIDAVSITTWNRSHRDIAVAALSAGKHVWCEKPMGLTLEEAEDMAAAARRSGRVTLLGYNYIRNPVLRLARRLVREGTIGAVFDFRGQVDEDYMADPDAPWTWRMRRDEAGLGVLGDLMCHLVSAALLLIGPLEQVCAQVRTVHKTRKRPTPPHALAEVDTEDHAHAIVRFAGGATGSLVASRVAHGRKNLLRIEVHGTKGMIAFDQERMNELEVFIAEGPAETRGFRRILSGPEHPPYGAFCRAPGHQLGFNDLKVIEAAHFLRCIAGFEQPFISFEDGLVIERAIHGMAASAASESWVGISAGSSCC
jgi:predicted dehydrogenase